MWEQRIVLKHHAYVAHVYRRVGQILPTQFDAATVPGCQPRHQFEQRGFARAAGADDCHQLACVDGQRQVIQALVCARVVVADVLKFKAHNFRPNLDDTNADVAASNNKITVAAQAKPVAP